MNLTINEQLMHDTKDANLCIFMGNLASWIKRNATKTHLPLDQRNFREGKYWSYNSIDSLVKYFGFWSTRTMRVIIKNCIQLGLIETSSFNKKKYDNTLWYTLTDKGLSYFPHIAVVVLNTLVTSDKPLVTFDKPIPNNTTTCINNNINTISDSDESPMVAVDEIVQTYHEELPDLPRIKVLDSKLKAQLTHMRKNWPKYQKDGKKFSIESFRDYLRYIKQHYEWFIKPYTTQNGNIRRNNLRVLTREVNIARIVNGEFNAQ